MAYEPYESFDDVKTRLDEIVEIVGQSELPLDEALALYEEAVALGLRASNLLESSIEAHERENEEVVISDDTEPSDASTEGSVTVSSEAPEEVLSGCLENESDTPSVGIGA